MIKRRQKKYNFSDEELLSYMRLPAAEKLRNLEKTNAFIQKITPARSKKLWRQLKDEGF